MKTWTFLGIIAASLLFPVCAAAQHRDRRCPPLPCPPVPCPPGSGYYIVPPPAVGQVPAAPGQPATPQPGQLAQPGQQAAPPAAPDERGQLAASFAERDVAGVSSGYRSGAPNVVGNQLGNNCLRFTFTPPVRSSFVASNDGPFLFPRSGEGGVLDPLSFNVFQVDTDFGSIFLDSPAVLRSRNPLSVDNELFRNGQPIPLASPDDAALLEAIRNQFLEAFGAGALRFAGGTIHSAGSEPGSEITPNDPFTVEGAFDFFASQFALEYCIVSPGNLVGRYKVSENNSPIPRDRAFFSYNYFRGTPFGPDVNRYTPGIEKTFSDGLGSVELRLPFASTLNGDLIVDNVLSNGTKTRLGNLQVALKAILYQTDDWLYSIGVGVAVPTADDVTARLADGTPLLRIRNQAVHVQPFLGFLYAPDEYFYFQGFSQLDIDVNGDPVSVNPFAPFGTSLQRIGRLRDRTLWSNDIAVGYWLYRDSTQFVSGISPQLEVHYDQTVDKYRTLQAGGVSLSGAGTYSSVALTGAVNLELRQDAMLTIATAVPLTGQDNRGFDWEVLIQFNYRFGASVAGGTPGLAGGR